MAEIPLPVTPFYSPSTQKFRENPDAAFTCGLPFPCIANKSALTNYFLIAGCFCLATLKPYIYNLGQFKWKIKTTPSPISMMGEMAHFEFSASSSFIWWGVVLFLILIRPRLWFSCGYPVLVKIWNLEMFVLWMEKNWRTLRNTLEARQEPTTNSTHVWHRAEIKPGLRWWEANTVTTVHCGAWSAATAYRCTIPETHDNLNEKSFPLQLYLPQHVNFWFFKQIFFFYLEVRKSGFNSM